MPTASILREMKHLLFICSRNKLRSPTAEEIFRGHPGIDVDSAGLADDAEVPLSEEQIKWADVIIVMEPIHRSRLNRKFGRCLAGKRIAVLGIPDNYGYMDAELIRLLRLKCAPYLP
jgi:predicted protein tyrosine phosphatase